MLKFEKKSVAERLSLHSRIGNMHCKHNEPAVFLYTDTKIKLSYRFCDPHSLFTNGRACSKQGLKQPESDFDCLILFLFNAEVKMSGCISPLLIYTFMA